MIAPDIWSKLHGAATHFPIALVLVSAFCELAASFIPRGRKLHHQLGSTATVTLLLGAAGSYVAVLTGLITAKWQFWGRATLLRHHQFVWPAFVLLTGLATWRALRGANPSRSGVLWFRILLLLNAGLIGAAGYWGGELFNEG
jgi:uncharacterized membrane protein